MSIDGYLKEGISVDSQSCFGSLVTISTIDGDIGMIEREFSLLVERAVNNHDRLQQENTELKDKTMKLTTTMHQLRDYLSDIEYDLDQADSLFTLKDEIALIDKALTIDHK